MHVEGSLPIRNVLMSRSISIFLGESKIDGINLHVTDLQIQPNHNQEIENDTEKLQSKAKRVTWLARLPNPMRKLSGFISRCRKDLECIYSIRVI